MVELNNAELVDLYTNHGYSTVVLARQFDVAPPTIRKRLIKCGVELRQAAPARQLDWELIRHLYIEQKLSLTEIACRLDCSFQRVSKILQTLRVETRPPRQNHCEITADLVQLIDGLMLGDGGLEHRTTYDSAMLSVGQRADRIEWLQQVQAELATHGLISTITAIKPSKRLRLINGKVLNSKPAVRLRTLHYVELLCEYRRWYPQGTKIVPGDTSVSPRSLAHWYLGDGSLGRVRIYKQLIFCTQGFKMPELRRLCARIKREYGWSPRVSKGPIVRMSTQAEMLQFLSMTRPFAPECFAYKYGDA